MNVDVKYCASSFLMHRTIIDRNKCFSFNNKPNFFCLDLAREDVRDSFELEEALKRYVAEATKDGKAALALSGGIDSAILARYMPKGSKAYTFKCVVPGMQVIDESVQAAKYAEANGLEHEIIEIYWDDMVSLLPLLMRRKGAPVHSIEIQIYKAALKAKSDGYDSLIFGESADVNYGGHSDLLSRDYTFGEYVERYAYVLPYKVLKESELVLEPFINSMGINGYIDVHKHVSTYYFLESMGSYDNACKAAGIEFIAPYSKTKLAVPLDYMKIRNGKNKYLIREIFSREYSGWEIPKKIPMPRPVNEWLADWTGPKRKEFWPRCTEKMTGDQKWLVYALEVFLNSLEHC